jgi:hypothetical protein
MHAIVMKDIHSSSENVLCINYEFLTFDMLLRNFSVGFLSATRISTLPLIHILASVHRICDALSRVRTFQKDP